MSVVAITAINVLNNPAPFTAPLEFEVHYEAFQDLEEDVEWKLVYVGSADTKDHDQELETVLVGPVTSGKYKFVLQANAPEASRIPNDDLVGLTAVLLTCSYREQEFLRVGYYVQVDFEDEKLKEDPPSNPMPDQLQRNLLDTDPRITHYPIDWPRHVQIPEASPIPEELLEAEPGVISVDDDDGDNDDNDDGENDDGEDDDDDDGEDDEDVDVDVDINDDDTESGQEGSNEGQNEAYLEEAKNEDEVGVADHHMDSGTDTGVEVETNLG